MNGTPVDLFSVSAVNAALLSSASTGTSTKPKRKGKREPFDVYEGDGSVRRIEPFGRDAWALRELIGAGSAGCTPITHVGPRWSGYVFKLKRIYGLSIETLHEPHGGDFKGTHARYVLRSRVLPGGDPVPAARFPASDAAAAMVAL